MRKKIIVGSVISVLWLGFCGWLFASSVKAYQDTKQTKHRENEFLASEIDVAVVENGNSNELSVPETSTLTWTEDESNSTCTATKQVQIKNVQKDDTNNVDAYIRVCIVPRWVTIPADTASPTDATSFTADVSAYNSPVGNTSASTTALTNYKPFGELTSISISGNTYTMGDVTFTLDSNWSDNWIFNQKDGYFYYKTKVAPGEMTEKLLASVSVPKSVLEVDAATYLQVDILTDAVQTEGNAFATLYPYCGITVNGSGELEQNNAASGTNNEENTE